MDPRRLSTADLLASGILNTPPPVTDAPEDREEASVEYSEAPERIAALLDENKLVRCPEYYGIPEAWKDADGRYRGILLQYRNVTANKTFGSAKEAAEWFSETAREVCG